MQNVRSYANRSYLVDSGKRNDEFRQLDRQKDERTNGRYFRRPMNAQRKQWCEEIWLIQISDPRCDSDNRGWVENKSHVLTIDGWMNERTKDCMRMNRHGKWCIIPSISSKIRWEIKPRDAINSDTWADKWWIPTITITTTLTTTTTITLILILVLLVTCHHYLG